MPDYLLNNIPDHLHQRWKIFAAALGITMKDFCFAALEEKISRVKKTSQIEEGEFNNGGEHSGSD